MNQRALDSGFTTDEAPGPSQGLPTSSDRDTLMRQIGSGIRLLADQAKILACEATDDDIEILPSGEVYIPGNLWRDTLNRAFGPMGWGVRPEKPLMDLHEKGAGRSILYREVFLLVARCTRCLRSMNRCECGGPVESRCVSTAIGAQEYFPDSKRMSFDDAAEAATTNGIARCCKPFSVYGNIWQRRWAEAAKARVGLIVMTRDWQNKVKPQWRRVESRPLDGEFALAAESPNKDRYAAPPVPAAKQEARRPAPTGAPPSGRPAAAKEAVPADAAGNALAPAPEGEKILVCRPVPFRKSPDEGGEDGVYWVINLDPGGEYVTDSKELVRELESFKAQGLRVQTPVFEPRITTRGTRRIIKAVTRFTKG